MLRMPESASSLGARLVVHTTWAVAAAAAASVRQGSGNSGGSRCMHCSLLEDQGLHLRGECVVPAVSWGAGDHGARLAAVSTGNSFF